MKFYSYEDLCLCPLGGRLPEENVKEVRAPFAPLVFVVQRDPAHSRGLYAIHSLSELSRFDGVSQLLPPEAETENTELSALVRENGATVLNTAFRQAYSQLLFSRKKKGPFRLSLVGLGDVGGFALTALRLLGGEDIASIRIFDPNTAQCARYELELNQVLLPGPRIEIASMEDLFDCDAFLFTASRGVPPVGTQGVDVRMVQYQGNKEMIASYARMAREAKFQGLFAEISDPVDQLARAAFLEATGEDFEGLLPEQIQGYGLGVMQARANYYARQEGLERAYAFGPHGKGLVVANALTDAYDGALSARLTEATITANLKVRDLGFKPFIAPALSSAALSVLRTLRGEFHEGAVCLGGAYFGCRSRYTKNGLELEQQLLHPDLFRRIEESYRCLEEFQY